MIRISPIKVVLVLLFAAALLHGQGTLRGVVKDTLNNEALIGANVFLPGTSLGDATDLEGQYNIVRISAGKHIIRVTYIGYKPKEVEINIADGQVLILNVLLAADVLEGEEVVITGQAAGQAAAINQQRTSNTIVNVVSEEKIKELPDANAAESIGRLPGVSLLRSGGEANKVILRGLSDKYTNVTIDGIGISSTDSASRGLDLSTISQGSLAGVELFKALTADKDGDAIAGSINLVTRIAPEEREIRAELRGGYNWIEESPGQYDFNLRYGERFFEGLFGVQAGGNVESRIRSNEQINLDYDQSGNNQTDYVINDLRLQYTDEERQRHGLNLILDYKTPDNGVLKFTTVYSSTERDYVTSWRNHPAGGGIGGAVTYSYRYQIQQIKTFNSSLTGNNNLSVFNLYWGLSFSQATTDFPYDYNLEFLEPSIDGSSGMRYVRPTKGNPENYIDAAYNNMRATTLQQAYYRDQNNLDKEKSAFLNISHNYSLGDMFAGEIKGGGKYRIKNRSRVNSIIFSPYYLGFWQPNERMPDGSIRAKDFSGSYFEDFYARYQQSSTNKAVTLFEFLDNPNEEWNVYDKYRLYPLLNRDKLAQWYDLNKNGVDNIGNTEYRDDPTAKQANYEITERIGAVYITNTLNIGQFLTFIAGVRVEEEDNDYRSAYSPANIGGFPVPLGVVKDTTASHKETIVLPNFHLNFKPDENLNIRVAAYKALARPDFNYRLNTSFAWRGADVSSNKEHYMGNPKLKTAQAWNFEINTSYFGNEVGLISFSAYYKEIKDQYHMLNQLNTSGDVFIKYLGLDWQPLHSGTYQITVPYNSPHPTKVWGFEFEHQMNFTFLPGLWKNIVLNYNGSLVKSETYLLRARTDTIVYFLPQFPGIPFFRYEDKVTELKQQLEEQPEFYANVSLGYDIGGFSGRVSLFHQSRYNLSFSSDRRGDIVINPYTRLDLSLKYQVTSYLSALLNINNLTNIKEGNSIYNHPNNYVILNVEERYGITADFGVRLDL